MTDPTRARCEAFLDGLFGCKPLDVEVDALAAFVREEVAIRDKKWAEDVVALRQAHDRQLATVRPFLEDYMLNMKVLIEISAQIETVSQFVPPVNARIVEVQDWLDQQAKETT